MSKVIMQVSPLPTFMMNALQEADYLVHDHTYIKDPDALSKVTALIGVSADAKVDRRLLSMLPNLKMIALCGVGYDGLDLDAILAKNIVVTNTPGVMCDDVADLAMGLVLAVGRRIAQADRFMRNGDWVDEPFPMTQRVSGARLGIVGMGRVGRAVAQRAQGFDMQVSYTDQAPKPNVSHTFVADVKTLAAQVDYLVVAVPLMEATKNLINAEVLQALGPKGYVVNVAHGAVIELGRGNVKDVMTRVERVSQTLAQVTQKLGRKVSAIESADLRHDNGYALRVRGVSTQDVPNKR